MFGLVIFLALLALAGYMAYSSKTAEGWDIKKGLAAVVALGAAVWTWLSGLFSGAMPG